MTTIQRDRLWKNRTKLVDFFERALERDRYLRLGESISVMSERDREEMRFAIAVVIAGLAARRPIRTEHDDEGCFVWVFPDVDD